MDEVTRLAMKLKDNENPSPYSPVFGRVLSLPDLKIQIGSRIILDESKVVSVFDIKEQRTDDLGTVTYPNLGKTVALLPYADNQKYLAIGVVI